MQNNTNPIPLSLYIHLPWCIRKCPYCDFNSHKAPDTLPEELYVTALIRDLDEQMQACQGRALRSIFFGGGTPSLFSANSIDRILKAVDERFKLDQRTEITLEANPGAVDETRFRGFRKAGVNRLSIGLQSLQDDKLKILGRVHNREYAIRAIEIAQQSGFENINLDLMHGLPNQSVDDALADLKDALAFQTPHLSWYQLTIEPNTLFHHQPPTLPAEDILWEIQEQGKALLSQHGFVQYEISAYAKPSRECKHNTNYWAFGDYLGIGAGAHSKLTDAENNLITRHFQVKNPKDYLAPDRKLPEKKHITGNDLAFEFMLNGLRLMQGISLDLFRQRTGLQISTVEKVFEEAIQKKLLRIENNLIIPTTLGHRFLDDLTGMFLQS